MTAIQPALLVWVTVRAGVGPEGKRIAAGRAYAAPIISHISTINMALAAPELEAFLP